jgi:hypothetical protein
MMNSHFPGPCEIAKKASHPPLGALVRQLKAPFALNCQWKAGEHLQRGAAKLLGQQERRAGRPAATQPLPHSRMGHAQT